MSPVDETTASQTRKTPAARTTKTGKGAPRSGKKPAAGTRALKEPQSSEPSAIAADKPVSILIEDESGIPPLEAGAAPRVAEVEADAAAERAEETPTVLVREGVEFETAPPASSSPAAAGDAPAVSAAGIAPRSARDGRGGQGLSILMVASEAVPFAKTGGLADVAGALPAALGRLGHQVTLVLPRYRGVAVQGEPVVTKVVQLGPERHKVRIYEQPLGDGARAWLVDEAALFDRDSLYGTSAGDYADNPRRYALLARAALEGARAAGLAPDVVHAHDWQGGLVPVYLKTRFAQDTVLGGVGTVFTIHNIAYQGVCEPSWLPALDLGWDLFRTDLLEYWHQVSLLKAGIVFSDKITTVSPRYAREILTPEFAFGFEGVLASRQPDLVGVLNGIDTRTWNPETDPFIPRPYSIEHMSGKTDAKRALLKAYGLPADDGALRTPLVGMVSRMVDQKGLDLIEAISGELPGTGARFVVLGTGEPRYEEMWRRLAKTFPDRIAVKVGFDEPLSHLVEAGADLFLMPSRFEPCGLNQMYSLRYGTLPLVRATGGLDDTVENYDPHRETGNGFKFWEASGLALLNTLRWALRVYEHKPVWQRLQREAMRGDFSWDRSAREYAALYAQVARRRP